ncbi:erythromycin esterase family protein [Glycomyces sp. TRM65418]|uniref:erythromycin esterase family protein n=1 Tax=Glycomyces sp. TRM65418 TaxID=2867006 RepID=UPI001CE70FB8|nr:erythromycin esterase family protein [Glycomyces sp. TRM65418]MCC3764056.1 erythromycin esterase family protein [Glycomyces sp. TRM65418]QZD53747.1 erythromycin esterase family protein [Glycomyces sp. TRM65418]
MNDTTNEQVRQWIKANAHPLDDLSALPAIIGDAAIVGIGETTRAAHEIDRLRLRMFQVMVDELGFRALAIKDGEIIGERLDDLVRGGGEDPEAVLAEAWPPWRTEETVAALEWIRSYNREHPDDPVRVFGTDAAGAQPYHYDAVVDYVRRTAPQRLDAIKALLAGPRSAHRVDEHIQRFRGAHPGRPFAEDARDAYDLVAALPEDEEREHVLRYAQAIVDHHSSSVAAGMDFAAWMRTVADTLLRRHRETGAKIAYWDGIAITANSHAMQVAIDADQRFTTAGGHLRERLGDRYLSMMIGFGEGEIHDGVRVPAPPADYAETALGTGESYYLDLRTPAPEEVARWLEGGGKVRVVPGVYDPAEDEKHHVVAESLQEWFDVVAYLPRITPTTVLESAG